MSNFKPTTAELITFYSFSCYDYLVFTSLSIYCQGYIGESACELQLVPTNSYKRQTKSITSRHSSSLTKLTRSESLCKFVELFQVVLITWLYALTSGHISAISYYTTFLKRRIIVPGVHLSMLLLLMETWTVKIPLLLGSAFIHSYIKTLNSI